ncbi:Ribose-5-phosphate isomerase B [Clavibacter michiganensis subsp. michiganensis]|nr:Ribose-5-phosphate isomerase B [Clavibacter michiganensis subsp. michiganensis]
MRIHIATDHAGLDFSRYLTGHLTDAGHDVVDHGPTSYDALDDYPSFCIRAARAVVADQRDGATALGVVCSAGRATASRSRPTRSRASARRSSGTCRRPCSRASTTTPT